jgi:thiosulfate/3-mercaptopyruvate sulfurtransferase
VSLLPASPLVSAEWLLAHHGEVLVLDASIDRRAEGYFPGHAVFAAGHIPGAGFADLFDEFSNPSAPFPFTCPQATQLERAARRAGIGRETDVVVYDSLSGAWAARLWWLLHAFGHEHVRVLDGGLAAWTRAGGKVAKGASPEAAAGNFSARPQPGFFVDADEVQASIGALPMLCATRAEEHAAGHIPGSHNLPYAALLATDGTLDLALAAQAWRGLGLSAQAGAVLYCGGGINAAGLALAFTAIGHRDLAVYDGSLNEWRADPARPLQMGA